jgi:hypothetical protein
MTCGIVTMGVNLLSNKHYHISNGRQGVDVGCLWNQFHNHVSCTNKALIKWLCD